LSVKETIKARRAYRSLEPVEITEELIRDLAESARLTPSCFNNQPWRCVFAHDPEVLKKLHGAMSRGNNWVQAASIPGFWEVRGYPDGAQIKPRRVLDVNSQRWRRIQGGEVTEFLD